MLKYYKVKIVVIGLLAGVLFFLTACSDQKIYSGTLKLQKFHGKWVFVNYWASWCESCQVEVPELNAFSRDHPNKVVFFAVNYDGLQGSSLAEAVKKADIHFKILSTDPADTLKLPPVDAVPTTFVFSPNGNLYETLLGPQSEKKLEEIIQ